MSTTVGADITWDEAQAMLRRSEARFESGDVEGLVGRYDENIVIRYADLPPIHGRAAAERFMRARFARQPGRMSRPAAKWPAMASRSWNRARAG